MSNEDNHNETNAVVLRHPPKRRISKIFSESFRYIAFKKESFRRSSSYEIPKHIKTHRRVASSEIIIGTFSYSTIIQHVRQPPAPLVVRDPPSSEDGTDLEDVKHLGDSALLNGSSGNFGSAGTARSAPSTPQGTHTDPLSCNISCASPSIQRSPSHSIFNKSDKASSRVLSNSTETVMTAQARVNDAPPRSPKATKEAKLHTISKTRQKKFNRHFPTIDSEEKLLNYYSCALIGDILLQGHLYISNNYFAFYSNVFGYVTKLLIPVLTVQEITKEKTARIIPNAVGIVTSEDKHVFGSLMSRDSTLQFMKKVWNKAKAECPTPEELEPPEVDISTESAEEGSGREDLLPPETSPFLRVEKEKLLQKEPDIVTTYERKSSKTFVKTVTNTITEFRKLPRQNLLLVATTLLLTLLFLSAAVLLYRISKIQNRYSLSLQDNLGMSGSDDVYNELLQWQTDLHSKSAGAVHSFLDSNLDQIAKVRQSLEALSTLLIQNNNPSHEATNSKQPSLEANDNS